MDKNEVNIDYILAFMREQIGNQSQDIAILKSTVATLNNKIIELQSKLDKVE